jgi:DivIVA domain-containing protein
VHIRCLECGAESAKATQVCARCGAPVAQQRSVAAGPVAGAASDAAGWAAPAAIHANVGQQPSNAAPDSEVDGAILAEWVETQKFSTTRLRPGYDQVEVDAFLKAIHDTFLGVREPSLTSDEIRNKQFSTARLRPGYDEEAVDVFLDEAELRLATQDLPAKPAGMADAWRDFGKQPGTHLSWVRAGAVRRELRTAEQQTIASLRYGWPTTVRTGGRTFSWKRVTGSSWPGIAEIIGRSHPGYPLRPARRARAVHADLKLRELLDETACPILYTSGRNYNLHAEARITFPDQRWLRFPVRGTRRANAIMTAVDQAGNKVARYRIIGTRLWNAIEITVHPGQQLTDELALAITISAPWLSSYFSTPSEGGGG